MLLLKIRGHFLVPFAYNKVLRMSLHRRINIFTKKYGRHTINKLNQRFTSTNASEWTPRIGLEIHAQIATKSKLFSAATTNFASPINSAVSLFDCAVPGTMPVLNRKCVEAGVLTALALTCELKEVSMFERKHYFYADLPAGFQITQQKKPLAVNGEIQFYVSVPGKHSKLYVKSSKIKQIQLEQDSGKSLHIESTGRSLIDLNRAGIPLLELVFEPDLTDAEEAAALVKELILILELLGTCSCKMEEGAMRVDANVSVSRENEPLGIRTEIKNIGSVRALAAAIKYEVERQISVLETGGNVINETRTWDAERKATLSMRRKEEKHDYRFMPETNLPHLRLHVNENVENKYDLVDVVSLRKRIPKLPEEIRNELTETYHLSPQMITAIMGSFALLRLFYTMIRKQDREPQLIAKFLSIEVMTFLHENNLQIEFCEGKEDFLGELVDLLQSKKISLLVIEHVLNKLLLEPDKMPQQIIEENNWFLISDVEELRQICLEVIQKNPKIVKQYKSGKKKVFKALLGQVAQRTNKSADMAKVSELLESLLN